ncbi:MAG: DUF4011 domain-containing protein [Candidatus Moeniiplasma glomeromycotorum]|nr:DUF4011 domain-containing protein [Candidatus Moeniiplasma glomeromycotorum]MCE8168161.1 DUF4011 domain-containing protein [Candidatus Moeniiplasma glomeromycotorum]MCE8169806.1 DUF4011 domain-containing protein [Candidatus Moeniiplasma glomeromycotorum]
MPNPYVKPSAEIIYLTKLRDKLLDLKSNSPKIKLYLRKELTWDLWELEELASKININSFIASNINSLYEGENNKEAFLDFSPLFQLLEEVEEKEKIRKSIKQLKRNWWRIYQEKGINSLFLSVFFLRGYFSKKYVINAPLFFFPAKFQKNDLGIIIGKTRKVNYTLLYFLKKMFNLEDEVFTKFKEKLESYKETSLSSLLLYTHQTLQEFLKNHVLINLFSFNNNNESEWINETLLIDNNRAIKDRQGLIALETNFAPNDLKLEKFLYLTLSNRPKKFKEDELEISFNTILVIDRETNLSLFNDFEQIIEKYSNDSLQDCPASGLDLLTKKMEYVECGNEIDYSPSFNYSQPDLDNQIKEDKKIYTPFDSDPSQTRILKKALNEFHKKVLCIDGPPGTGKTQLICNLIGNCLIRNQKVAVICEKNVALQVIHDKLSSIGIKAIKISELEQTTNIYRQIVEIEELARKTRLESLTNQDYEKKVADLEKQNSSFLTSLGNFHKIQKEFHDLRGVLLGEVYIKIDNTKRSSELISLIKQIQNKEQLDVFISILEKYTTKLNQIFQNQKEICLNLKHLFYPINQLKFTFSPSNQIHLNDILNSLLQELRGEKGSKILSQFFRIKLVREKSKDLNTIHLLEKKQSEIKSLSAREELKILFLFLDIKNLKEFWQNCSSENFLLSLQEFVNVNFSVIRDISRLIVEFDENTQTIIEFLLEKVFDLREFDWLENYSKIIEKAVYINWLSMLEEKEPNLYQWNFNELTNIHQERKKNNNQKKKMTQEILKIKQQINHQRLINYHNLMLSQIKKKRNVPRLRKIFPTLLDCFPIWLTTPEVMASASEFGEPFFDLLIFDESSQITLESSIPLLIRGKKCLVIGDEKQLPPTNFFKLLLDDDEEFPEEEEEEEKVINLETKNINLQGDDLRSNFSLLNWAKKYTLSKQKETLLYHYRSKYPELIDFSNQAFYHGHLQVIRDSEDRKKFPIEYHKVKGSWRNNQNEIEASYIIKLLKKELINEEKTIGIVTFSYKQMKLIESYDEVVEKAKTKNNLFIKNLEEVQGDERDIVVFSIGYAQNEEGKLHHWFGALNKEGGENRLNVAVSRAKEKVIIVASIFPKDLNVSSSKNIGPKLLKKYLEYCFACQEKDLERQQQILAEEIPKIINLPHKKDKNPDQFDSPFEEEVYEKLVELGYEVETQVGSFGYKIDLAIRNPQNNQYIVGIECDGWTYHHNLEDIERDEYRQNILESKGWNIIRICSQDWYGDNCKNRTINWIKGEIDKVKNNEVRV